MSLHSPPIMYKRCPNLSVGIKQKLNLRSSIIKGMYANIALGLYFHHPEGPIGSFISENIKGFLESSVRNVS